MADRFDKFSELSRQALTLAQQEAQRFKHNYIGTEHLLLGMIREGEGIAAGVLESLGVSLRRARTAAAEAAAEKQAAALPASTASESQPAAELPASSLAAIRAAIAGQSTSPRQKLQTYLELAQQALGYARLEAKTAGMPGLAATLEEIAAMLQAEIAQLQAEDQRG